MKKKGNNKIKTKKMPCVLFLIFITSIFFLIACGKKVVDMSNIETVEELSYDYVSEEDCIVYIEEDGAYVPYLVLTSDYGGNVLLLRKELMAETRPYKENESGLWPTYELGSYYEDSDIDFYLNADFIDIIDLSVKEYIVDSNIEITDKASYNGPDRISTSIIRKVFLLSLEEMAFNGLQHITVQEGTPLKYFEDDYTRRLAFLSDGRDFPYWTRTPELWENYKVVAIGIKKVGSASAHISNGVRPAFCVKRSTPVVQSTDVVEGETVFVIE